MLRCQWLSWRGNDNWRVGLQNCGGTAVGAWVPESSLLERSRDGQSESLTNAVEEQEKDDGGRRERGREAPWRERERPLDTISPTADKIMTPTHSFNKTQLLYYQDFQLL